jgi:hypothetical protein
MSATRRILAAGLPAAAALVFAASPALAAESHGSRPAVTASPCAQAERDKCDYGNAGPVITTPGGDVTGGGVTGQTVPGGGQHTRGHGGYATTPTTTHATSPATTQPTSPAPAATTPTAHVDTVPPTATPSPSGTVQGAVTPSPTTSGGVSAGHALPVTGAPAGAVISLGALMVAAGAASVWYTRRRRSA